MNELVMKFRRLIRDKITKIVVYPTNFTKRYNFNRIGLVFIYRGQVFRILFEIFNYSRSISIQFPWRNVNFTELYFA